MKIIVDAFGGDNAPDEILKGCRMAKDALGMDILLTGAESAIRSAAARLSLDIADMEILDCPDVLTMEDDPMSVRREKKNSSLAVCCMALRDGKGDAFVSAGNSGAVVVGATLFVKRLKGVLRVCFAPVLPKSTGFFLLADSGANNECTPQMLAQFGLMGSVYVEKVMGVKSPRVGLLNVGAEEHKGGPLQQAAFRLLSEDQRIRFVGNVEARDVPDDAAEVIVTDGFTGNVFIKTYEGVALVLMDKIKGIFKKNLKNQLAAAMVLGDMKQFKKDFDYNSYGGAPILGCSKPVFKVHGSAKAGTMFSALSLTAKYVSAGIIDEIAEAVGKGEGE